MMAVTPDVCYSGVYVCIYTPSISVISLYTHAPVKNK